MLTVGSLFAGIGGFDLGLERAGMRVAWQSEIDPWASAVLRKHWPSVLNHGDIRGIRAGTVEPVDVICGGFPCQPFSHAGKRRGKDDDRHLWPEMLRVIDELRPAWVIGENVAGIISMELDQVLSDLEAIGYASRPVVVPAVAVDAPHRRDRVWILAHSNSGQRDGSLGTLRAGRDAAGVSGEVVADADEPGPQGWYGAVVPERGCEWSAWAAGASSADAWREWEPEPNMGRVANGIPRRVDRLRCLGNAIVPQIAEVLGRAIIAAEMRAAE